ncbi:MAG: formylmethanofuran--tetrahydromethanopterin N-formyltransferase [bacterium]
MKNLESPATFKYGNCIIYDTFAEAFPMTATRLIVTATNRRWAQNAANVVTGYATSVIACDAEAGIDQSLSEDQTPDGRPGFSILFFAFNRESLEKAVVKRVGQCIMTCPTTACFNGISDKSKPVKIGGKLRRFGDGYQVSKLIGDRRFWRIPVMDGEFVCEDEFGTTKAIGGGNILILGKSQMETLIAAENAVESVNKIENVIMPFPGGVVRSGSKVGSKYKGLIASTNHEYAPTLKFRGKTLLPEKATCCYEIVMDGLNLDAINEATSAAIISAAMSKGVIAISAGNYGGKLGPYHIHLKDRTIPNEVLIK